MNQEHNAYQGFEVISHKFLMNINMSFFTALFCLAIQAIMALLLSLILVPPLQRELAILFPISKILRTLYQANIKFSVMGEVYTAGQISTLNASRVYGTAGGEWKLVFVLSLTAWLMFPVLIRLWKSRAKKLKNDQHVRGARCITEDELREEVAREGGEPGILKIGSITLPDRTEGRHQGIFGMTGSGKSTLLFQYLDAITKANRRCTVNDFKGELTATFYRPEIDQLLNPLDARGLGWTLLNEVRMKADFAAIAGSNIPPSNGEDRFWSMAAQDVFRGVMAANFQRGERLNSDLWRVLTSPINEIADLLKTTPMGAAGLSYIQDASSKQAASVIAVLMSYVSWLEYAPDGPFSTRDWVANGQGTIFVTGRTEVENTVRPFTSLFFDLLGKRILSSPDTNDKQRTIHMLLDEFSNMQKLPTIKRLATAGRSKRVVLTLGAQEIAAYEHIYGKEDARTLLNNCGTKYVMALGDPDSMDYFSRLVGKEEYLQAATTFTTSVDESRGGENHSQQLQTRDAVMSSSIRKLRVGEGYLILPSHDPALVTIPLAAANTRKPKHPDFLLRDGLSLDDLLYRDVLISSRAEQIKATEPPKELVEAVESNMVQALHDHQYDDVEMDF